MRFSPSTNMRRRRSYSATMRRTSVSAPVSATRAASCAVVGADMIPYWWTLRMPSRMSRGAAAQPTRQPVMAYALEKPPSRIVRSRAPSNELKAWCT